MTTKKKTRAGLFDTPGGKLPAKRPGAKPRATAVELMPIDRLQLDPTNARRHDDRNIASIVASIRRFGFRGAIVARRSDLVVVAGNGRLCAARALGMKEIPVQLVDDDDRAAKAFGIADNRAAELAEWDLEQLARNLGSLGTDAELLAATGFNEAEVENLLKADWTPAAVEPGDADVDAHRRDPIAPKGDDSRATIVLTGAQLIVALRALDKMRGDDKRVTFGEMVRRVCMTFLGEKDEPVAAPRRSRA